MIDTSKNSSNSESQNTQSVWLDTAWLSGVAAVNLAVWNLFGAKYIGLALIAYCFLFLLTLRKQINAAYPAQAGVEYNIGFNLPNFNMSSTKTFWRTVVCVPLFFVVVLSILVVVIVFYGPDFVEQHIEKLPTISTVLVCNGFLVLRYRALFVTCCGKAKLTNHSAKWLERMVGTKHNASFLSSRLVRASAVFILLWGGVLFAYITATDNFFNWMWESSTRVFETVLFLQAVIVFPSLVHIIFIETLATVLRGWGDKR